jgi:hypothetical protein
MRAHTARTRERERKAAGPTGLVQQTPGARLDDGTGAWDVRARGGLAVRGRAVQPIGASAVETLVDDAVLTTADAGVRRVIDLSSPASTGIHVTLPAAADLVGCAFDFVVVRDADASNNAVFSLSLKDDSPIVARAIAAKAHVFPAPCFSLTTDTRVFQTRTALVRTPGVFCFFSFFDSSALAPDLAPDLAVSCFKPIDFDTAAYLQRRPEIGDSVSWHADPSGQDSIVTGENGELSSSGFRMSVAATGDTVRVWAAAPDLVVAECVFQYATLWS